ncbi:MAG: hypothetical protein H7301_02870 [Cryobacterium sp.]|nr:hypothetical protein [Oligoflexia bacterium]
MPVLDQDGTGTCYAQVAAQLINFKLKTNRSNFQVSSIDLALVGATSSRFFDRDSLTAGQVAPLIEAAGKYGVASKACVDSEIKRFHQDAGLSTEQFTAILESMNESSSYFLTRAAERRLAEFDISQNPDISSCRYKATLDVLDRRGLWGSSVTEVLNQVLYRCRSERKKISNLDYDSLTIGTDAEMMNEVDRILDRKIPVSAGLCAPILLESKEYSGLAGKSPPLDRGSLDNFTKEKCEPHQTLIVGRNQFSDGSCRYLVRNSWGGAWKTDGLTCACKTSDGVYHSDCKSAESGIKVKEKQISERISESNRLSDRYEALKIRHPEEAKKVLRESKIQKMKFNIDLDELKKLREEYEQRAYVGCWIDSKNLKKNVFHVGSLK